MSLEIELHAVPHLKGLINVSNISGRQERGSMDSIHQAKLKTTHFTSYRANQTDPYLPVGGGGKFTTAIVMVSPCVLPLT